MAQPLGIVNASGASQITFNTAGLKGAGRYGLIGVTFNGPSHNGGVVSLPTGPAGFTEIIRTGGTAFRPGVAAWWGPLTTQDTVTVTSSPATVHLSGSIAVFNTMTAPTATARVAGFGSTVAGTFPNAAAGGYMALLGINGNTRTATSSLAGNDYSYESPAFSGATVFVGDQAGFTSQGHTFTIDNPDDYAYTLISFADAAAPTGWLRAKGTTTTTTSATSIGWTIPAATQVGDVIVVHVNNSDVADNFPQPETGWTSQGTAYNNRLYWRTAQAGDPGSTVTFDFQAAAAGIVQGLVINEGNITGLTATPLYELPAGSPLEFTLNVDNAPADSVLIIVGRQEVSAGDKSAPTPATGNQMVLEFDGPLLGTSEKTSFYAQKLVAADNTSRTFTSVTANGYMGIVIAIPVAASTPPPPPPSGGATSGVDALTGLVGVPWGWDSLNNFSWNDSSGIGYRIKAPKSGSFDTFVAHFVGATSGYGDGDGGLYEIRVIRTSDQAVMGFGTHDPQYVNGLNRPSMTFAQVKADMFPLIQLYTTPAKTTAGTLPLTAGVTYDIYIQNVHPNPAGNFMGLNVGLDLDFGPDGGTGRLPYVPVSADFGVRVYAANSYQSIQAYGDGDIPICSIIMTDGTQVGHPYIDGLSANNRTLTTGHKARQPVTVTGVGGATRVGVRCLGSGTIVGRITNSSGTQIGTQTGSITIGQGAGEGSFAPSDDSGHQWYSGTVTVNTALTACAIEWEVTSGSIDFQAMQSGRAYNMPSPIAGGAEVNTGGGWGWFNSGQQNNAHLTAYFVPTVTAATVPGAPTSLTATPGNGTVTLNWTAPASNGGATISSYSVQYRVTSVGGAWTTTGASATTTKIVTGLTNATGYDFRVAALNTVGTGAWSNTATGTPAAAGGGGGTGTSVAQFRPLGESTSNPTFFKVWTRKWLNTWPGTSAGDGQATGDSSWDLAANIVDRYPQGVVQGVNVGDANRGATGGSNLAGMIARWDAAAPAIVSGGVNVLSIMIGVNDIGHGIGNGGTPSLAGMKTSISSFVSARQGEGWNVIVGTLHQFRYPAEQNGKRSDTLTFADIAEWNTHLTGLPGVIVVDIRNDPALGNIGASGRAALPDEIHFNTNGNTRISDLMFTAINSATSPATPPLTVVGVTTQTADVSKIVPLAANAGTDRQAFLVASWQGAQHNVANMGTDFGPLSLVTRLERGNDFRPGIGLWAGAIPAGTPDLTLPVTHDGAGWMLVVTEGADIPGTTFTTTPGDGTTYGTNQSSAGIVVAAVSTNAQGVVTAPAGWTSALAPKGWFSAVDGAYRTGGGQAAFTFGTGPFAGITFAIVKSDVVYNWTNLADTILTGAQIGSGIGTDLNSTDNNGVGTTAGGTVELIEWWDVTPAVPQIETWKARVTLPTGYDPNAGYRVFFQLVDATGTPIGPEVECSNAAGLKGIVGGETVGVFTANLELF